MCHRLLLQIGDGRCHSCLTGNWGRINDVQRSRAELDDDLGESPLTSKARLGRRAMLRQSLATGGAVLVAGCVGRGQPLREPVTRPRNWARVLVSRERVIREVTGLRPFRAPGFVVRAEALGDRTVVHNYGHGGGGISLCWGSSALAVELASATGHRRFAVRVRSHGAHDRTTVAGPRI